MHLKSKSTKLKENNPKVEESISNHIREHGPLSISTYMDYCLHQDHGYYRQGNPLGRGGDFVTSPHISSLFGYTTALWLAQQWHRLNSPSSWNLIELGPGTGQWMIDIIHMLSMLSIPLPHVFMIEIHEALRQQQKNHIPFVSHAQSLEDIIHTLPLVPTLIIANEFFDALPVDIFMKEEGTYHQLRVLWNEKPYPHPWPHVWEEVSLESYHQGGLPEHIQVYEVCPRGRQIATTIDHILHERKGAALIIDYGYGPGEYHGLTLQAISHHQKVSPWERPGLTDLTTHVDFGALMNNFPRGKKTFGTQGDFLKTMAIDDLARKYGENLPHLPKSIDRLCHPQHMGQLFRVLEVTY